MPSPGRNLLMDMGYSIFDRVRVRLAEDAGWICFYCRDTMVDGKTGGPKRVTIDHKIPLSRGGSWKRYNLVASCHHCNTTKGSMTAEEFMELPNYFRG